MMSQTVEKRRLKKLLSGTSRSRVMYVVVVQVTGGRFSRAPQPTETNPKTLSFSRPYWLGRYDSSWDNCKSTESLSEPPCRSLFLLLDLLYLYQMMRYDMMSFFKRMSLHARHVHLHVSAMFPILTSLHHHVWGAICVRPLQIARKQKFVKECK